jgi:hypothetical protein
MRLRRLPRWLRLWLRGELSGEERCETKTHLRIEVFVEGVQNVSTAQCRLGQREKGSTPHVHHQMQVTTHNGRITEIQGQMTRRRSLARGRGRSASCTS